MKKTILIFLLILTAYGYSQKTADKTFGSWYMLSGNHKLSPKFSFKSLAHFRFFDTHEDLQQILIRLGGNYKLGTLTSFTLGYAYLNTDQTFASNGGEINEHRIYEDFNIKNTINTLKLSQRFRIEHRFFETVTKHWFRYQFSLTQPITKRLNGFIYNETFFNFNGKAFSQNWLGGGFKYKLNQSIKLTLGYQKIYNGQTNFDRLLLGFSFLTNHTKK